MSEQPKRKCGGCVSDLLRAIAGKAMHAAAANAKVALQVTAGVPIDQASAATIRQRRDICRDCEHSTKSKKLLALQPETKGLCRVSRCLKCECPIISKTRLASEACPLGLWPSEIMAQNSGG